MACLGANPRVSPAPRSGGAGLPKGDFKTRHPLAPRKSHQPNTISRGATALGRAPAYPATMGAAAPRGAVTRHASPVRSPEGTCHARGAHGGSHRPPRVPGEVDGARRCCRHGLGPLKIVIIIIIIIVVIVIGIITGIMNCRATPEAVHSSGRFLRPLPEGGELAGQD